VSTCRRRRRWITLRLHMPQVSRLSRSPPPFDPWSVQRCRVRADSVGSQGQSISKISTIALTSSSCVSRLSFCRHEFTYHDQGGQYGGYNLSPLLCAHRLDDAEHVKLEVWSAPGRSKPTFAEATRQSYKPAKKGDQFGPAWTNHWFKLTLHIPSSWSEYERVQLEFDCSGEAMVFTTDGDPIHGEFHLFSQCEG